MLCVSYLQAAHCIQVLSSLSTSCALCISYLPCLQATRCIQVTLPHLQAAHCIQVCSYCLSVSYCTTASTNYILLVSLRRVNTEGPHTDRDNSLSLSLVVVSTGLTVFSYILFVHTFTY